MRHPYEFLNFSIRPRTSRSELALRTPSEGYQRLPWVSSLLAGSGGLLPWQTSGWPGGFVHGRYLASMYMCGCSAPCESRAHDDDIYSGPEYRAVGASLTPVATNRFANFRGRKFESAPYGYELSISISISVLHCLLRCTSSSHSYLVSTVRVFGSGPSDDDCLRADSHLAGSSTSKAGVPYFVACAEAPSPLPREDVQRRGTDWTSSVETNATWASLSELLDTAAASSVHGVGILAI